MAVAAAFCPAAEAAEPPLLPRCPLALPPFPAAALPPDSEVLVELAAELPLAALPALPALPELPAAFWPPFPAEAAAEVAAAAVASATSGPAATAEAARA